MKTMTGTFSLTGTLASARALRTKVAKTREALLKSSKLLGCITALVLTFTSLNVFAVSIPGATLTTTAGALTSTTTCVNGYWAPGWTGTPVKFWKWQVSTTGYQNIVFATPTSSSATGPHSAQFQWSIDNVNWNAMTTLTWSGTGCTGTGNLSLPSGVDNQATVYVRALMTGASASGGTSRMSIQAFSGDLIPAACTGTPTAGSISGATAFCGSGSTTLNLTGATAGVGISYQWQSSPAGAGTWSNVGTSSTTYNTGTVSASTDYRVQVTCSTGPTTSTTATATITVNALPTVGTLSFASGSNPFTVGDVIDIDPSVSGGTFLSNNTNAYDIDPTSGVGNADFGGTAVVTYTIVDGITLCSNSVTQNVDIVWPNTLALYAGINGTSTSVIPGEPDVIVNPLTATGFGSNSPCGSGGLSGLTVNTSVTSFANGNPHVSYKISPTAGNALNVFQIHARARVSGTGPTKARLAYSFDGINWIPDGEVNLTSGSCGASANNWYWTVGGPTITGITGDFYVGIFPYASGSNSGVFQVNTLEVYGEVSSDDPCSGGTLDDGNLISLSNTSICGGSGSRTLEFQHDGGVGISYQYEFSTDGGVNWNPTSAADTNVFFNTGTITTTTMYRVIVTCAFGGSIASAPITITVTPAQPHDAVDPASTVYFVGGTQDFTTVFTNTGLTPDSVKWVSNYVTTANVDASGVVANFNFPANDVRITRVKYNGGCATATTDTFDIIHECAIAYYLGENGTSVDVTDVQNVTSTNVASTGFGTGANCSSGGKSGMNTAPASFSTSGAHVSYEVLNNDDVMGVGGLSATVRISSTGPVYARLAYRVHDGLAWGNWIDEGADHEITPDDCGYSNDEIFWCEAGTDAVGLPVLTNGQKIEVAVFPHSPSASGGTFQLNSMTVCGRVAPFCGELQSNAILDAGNADVDGTVLPNGVNPLHLNGVAPTETYWGTIGIAPGEGYFGCGSTGNNTGDFNVVSPLCEGVVVAAGYRGAGSCFDYITATVILEESCGKSATGVNNIGKVSNVSFYPNPATAIVNVVAQEAVNVSVISVDGKLLIDQNDAKTINISNLANGIYFIKAYDAQNNLLKTEKLIKQ